MADIINDKIVLILEFNVHKFFYGLLFSLAACSNEADIPESSAAESARMDEHLTQSERDIAQMEIEMKVMMLETLTALGKSCEEVRSFKDIGTTKLEIVCASRPRDITYVIDKKSKKIEQR